MDVTGGADRPGRRGSPEYFTGDVRLEILFEAAAPARAAGARVTFAPGARTAWHTHPFGQALLVTDGVGLAQSWGGPVREIRPGDVVWFAPGEKHWHGAAPAAAMTHIAVHERGHGGTVDWLEPVGDEAYGAGPAP